jgi:hypothetical protein
MPENQTGPGKKISPEIPESGIVKTVKIPAKNSMVY